MQVLIDVLFEIGYFLSEIVHDLIGGPACNKNFQYNFYRCTEFLDAWPDADF